MGHPTRDRPGTERDDRPAGRPRRALLVGVVAVVLVVVAASVAVVAGWVGDGGAAGDREPIGEAVSVVDHGAAGDGEADDTEAIRAALDAAVRQGLPLHLPAGTYRTTELIDVPGPVRIIDFADGAVIRHEANSSALRKHGSIGDAVSAAGVDRGAESFSAPGLDAAVGDWVILGSADLLHPQQEFRRGFLRQVTAVDGDHVEVDRAFHRSLETDVQAWPVNLAPSLEIRGGVIEHDEPLSHEFSLLQLEWVEDPVVSGTELRRCGRSGVRTVGTVGGTLDVVAHDCVDDHAGKRFGQGRHFGYGVEVTGPTRDLEVRGRSYRTRHAFTTNGSWGLEDKRLLLVGEPENVDVSMEVWETTSVGLDTHEPGHDIRFHDCTVRDAGTYHREGSTDGKEGGFGIFIRARATTVERCVVDNAADDGIVVSVSAPGEEPWVPRDGPVVTDTEILGSDGTNGMHLWQPTHVRDTVIRGPHRIGIMLDDDADGSTVSDTTIELTGERPGIGVLNARFVELDGTSIEAHVETRP